MCKCDKDVMNDLTKTEHAVKSLEDDLRQKCMGMRKYSVKNM